MVHLHSVRLRGFKTFAKPTELTFEPGVTVIIGPNGSGKSNIADAVLWVLGEQSPGNLRGRTMQDVIFSGPGGQRSSAVAEVSLVFDNGDVAGAAGLIPLGFQELEVTRRLTRDSGSEYRLNGSGCRLLDVQDLVGGLGLGREMHSVISQGKVEALLNSTPEVRRAMVEEAAGLGRFKKRRERAQAKLERTRQNLLRVADVEREVKSALRPLRQQVAAAEHFAEATEEWALAKARLLLHGLGGVLASLSATRAELAITEARREEIEAELAGLRRERASEEERFNAALEERERLGGGYQHTLAVAEQLQGLVVALRQRLARNEGERDRSKRRLEVARAEAASSAGRLQALERGTADEARLARLGGWTETIRAALEQVLPEYRSAAEREDELKDAAFELEAARSRALQEREFLRRELEERGQVSGELERVAAEAVERLAESERHLAVLRRELEAATAAAMEAEAGLRGALTDREEARAKADDAARAEAGLVEESAGLDSREAVLADLLRRKEGTPDGTRELTAAIEGARLLSELLVVEPGFERAAAAALGPVGGALTLPAGCAISRVFETAGVFEALLESEQVAAPGEAGKAAGQRTASLRPPSGTRDLWDVISGPAQIVAALRIVVPPTAILTMADDLAAAADDDAADGWRLVNRAGELLQPGVSAARRREVGVEALLKAKNELAAVAGEREGLVARREAARADSEAAANEMAENERRVREGEDRLHQAERTVTAQRGEVDLHERRLEEARLQLGELQARKEKEAGLTGRLQTDLAAVEEALAGREADLEEARGALRALQDRLESLHKTVGGLEEKKGQAALVEVRLRERCRALEGERARARLQRQAAEREMSRCDSRVGQFELYLPVLAQVLKTAEAAAETSRSAAQALEAQVEAVRARTEGTARSMRDRGGAEVAFQQEHERTTHRLTELRVDQARLEDRRVLFEEELSDLKRRHLSPRGLTPAEVAAEDGQVLAEAVERAERRRERIGPVNPLAEKECAEMEARAAFLAEQRVDLDTSVSQLQDVISELDGYIETAFAQIFAAAREHFSAVIAAVFPGAKGTLRLTEPKPPSRRTEGGADEVAADDEGEEREQSRGIALEVKFPNKAPRSLSLLSGGEKAMTAIAFLFSLFLARPCPFYILDEVEASLDDINIRRFLSLVRKYRDKTQFIIITHQRQTMEVADTLYGVALESDGTSRVLSRRLAIGKGA